MGSSDLSRFTNSFLARVGDGLPRGWVWRHSALGPLQTLMTVMAMVALGNHGYRAALREVFTSMHRAFGWGGDPPTPSVLTQARGKLSEKLCRDLFRRVSHEATSVVSRSRLRYRDFARIIAVDGTRAPLASTAANRRDFGCPFGEHLVSLPDHPAHQIRFVRGHRQGTKDVVLMTSLIGPEHSAAAIAGLYQRRWGIETTYREAKGWHGVENLPGRTKSMIRQEICVLMLFWLMEGELEGQARRVYADEIRQQPNVDPAWTPAEGIAESPVLFNRRLLATSVALLMAAAVTSLDDAVESWQVSIRYLWRNRARRRPGRTARRTSQRPHRIRMRDPESSEKALGGRKKSGRKSC